MSFTLRVDFGSIGELPGGAAWDAAGAPAPKREFVCRVRPMDASFSLERLHSSGTIMHDAVHAAVAATPDAGSPEASLARYVSLCLAEAGERPFAPTLGSELIEELRRLGEAPPVEMEPFFTRAFAEPGPGAGIEPVRRPPPRADQVFAHVLAGFGAADAKQIGGELERRGGFVAAAFRAAVHVAAPSAALEPGEALERWGWADWSTWLAGTCGIEVRTRRARRLLACLVRTASQRVIWLGDQLPDGARASAILHELSHWMLGHRPNTEYGADPARLTDFGRMEFQRQEREADAFARLLQASLQSLRAAMVGSPARDAAADAHPRAPRETGVAA